MKFTRIRTLLGSIAFGAIASAAGVIAWNIAAPLELPTTPISQSPRTLSASNGPSAVLPPLSAFAGVFDAALRRRLDDSSATAVPTVAAVNTSSDAIASPLHLVGTVIEPGHSVAFFRTDSGSIKGRAVGQKIGDVTVTAIQQNSALVQSDGRPMTVPLELPAIRSPGAPSLASSGSADEGVIHLLPLPPGTLATDQHR